MQSTLKLSLLAACLTLTACAIAPSGPSVMVLPGSNKPYDQFRNDDWTCRQEANIRTNGTHQSANSAVISSAAIGTAVGAIAGAAIGGNQGAAVGAGAGLLIGSASGSEAARSGSYGTQRQYDAVYIQCMYAHGHRVPVPANMAPAYSGASQPPPPPTASSTPPPPPPGSPPPPPPR